MQDTLWTSNFKKMYLGWILSAIGGIGFNVAFGLVIYDNTHSTLLSGIFVAVSMVPSILLPLIVAPNIDRQNPLKVLLRNEKILLFIFVGAYLFDMTFGFHYVFYLVFSILIASLGVISDLSTQSLAARLMKKDQMSKGYAILSAISPFISFIISPISILLYSNFGMGAIFLMYIIFTILDIAIESRIDARLETEESPNLKKTIFSDIKESLIYFNKQEDIKWVFIFFAVVMFSSGSSQLIYPYFQTNPNLSIEAYAMFASLTAFGYLFGAIFHYFIEIPRKYRYGIAVMIYLVFIVLESSLLLVSLPLMYAFKMLMGVLGMNSANIRNSAVQSKLQDAYRAQMNALFSILVGLGTMLGNMFFGFLAEYLEIPLVVIIAQGFYLLAVIVIMIPQRKKIEPLYNLEHITEGNQ